MRTEDNVSILCLKQIVHVDYQVSHERLVQGLAMTLIDAHLVCFVLKLALGHSDEQAKQHIDSTMVEIAKEDQSHYV